MRQLKFYEIHPDKRCPQCDGVGKLFGRKRKSIEPLLNCEVCKGTGEYEVNKMWQIQGLILKGFRIVNEITLRQMSRDHEIDPSNLSKMEKGIIKPNPDLLRVVLTLTQ